MKVSFVLRHSEFEFWLAPVNCWVACNIARSAPIPVRHSNVSGAMRFRFIDTLRSTPYARSVAVVDKIWLNRHHRTVRPSCHAL